MNAVKRIAKEIAADGSWLIQAGPGTGKTSLLVACIKAILQSGKIEGRSIACITYSNVAADELKSRLPLEYYPQFIGTIHSFLLQYVIYPYAHVFPEIPDEFQIVTDGYARPLLNEMVTHGFISNTKAHVPGMESAFERIGYNINGKFVDFSHKGISQTEMAKFVRLRLKNGLVSQQDILWYSTRLFCSKEQSHILESIGCRFTTILVDEFQDTTELQYAVLERLEELGKTDLLLVGDKNQSIFSFAGTHIDTFESCLNCYQSKPLPTNYRSTENIVRFTNLFLAKDMRIQCRSKYASLNIPISIMVGEASEEDRISKFLDILNDAKLKTEIENQDYLLLARGKALVKKLSIAKKEISNGQAIPDSADALDHLRDSHPRLNVILRDIFAAKGLICLGKNSIAFERLDNSLTNLILKANPGFGATHLVGLSQDQWRLMVTKCLFKLDSIDGNDIREWVDNFRKLLHASILECKGKKSGNKTILLNNLKKVLPKKTVFPIETCVQSAMANLERTDIVRTIHSAKGVETMAVMVISASQNQFTTWLSPAVLKSESTEESRIGFVAFTRPHKLLCIATNSIRSDFRKWLEEKDYIEIVDI